VANVYVSGPTSHEDQHYRNLVGGGILMAKATKRPRLGGPHYVVVGAHDRVLVLEGLLPRQLQFRAWLGSSAKIVSRAAAAIQELRRQPLDVVS
jgi:hypothetical protein